MVQKIRFDTTTKILSIVVLLIPVALFILPVALIKDQNIIPILTSLFLVIVFLISWLLHPTSYEITNEELLIHRPKGPIKISLTDIQSIEKTEPGFSIRLFGSGGLFGYFGLFSSNKLGKHHRYTGNNENLVLINAGKKKYLLSIHDELFFEELIKRTRKVQ